MSEIKYGDDIANGEVCPVCRRGRECEDDLAALVKVVRQAANICDSWARQSREGGWSTHQVNANRELADTLRRAAGSQP